MIKRRKVQPEIYFIQKDLKPFYQDCINQGSQGFDLVAPIDITFTQKDQIIKVNMGIVLKADDHYFNIFMRSSTFGKHRIKLTNSVAVIDESYCGINDELIISIRLEATLNVNKMVIKKGVKFAQAVFYPTYDLLPLKEFNPLEISRGGFGSTDNK
jgi:dUTPase